MRDGKSVRADVQTTYLPEGYSTDMYAHGGLRPAFIDHVRGKSLGTPMFVYRWADAKAALEKM